MKSSQKLIILPEDTGGKILQTLSKITKYIIHKRIYIIVCTLYMVQMYLHLWKISFSSLICYLCTKLYIFLVIIIIWCHLERKYSTNTVYLTKHCRHIQIKFVLFCSQVFCIDCAQNTENKYQH